MRIVQKPATRGSQRWLQQFVELRPRALDDAIDLGPLEWLSPLASDDFSEYRDQAFLDRLGVRLDRRPLPSFWPRGGPVWDGLAKTAVGSPVLIEAKSHVRELSSSCVASSPASISKNHAALRETQRGLGLAEACDWSCGFYQYANRLAHAYLLNELNGVPADLVFFYFVGDGEMRGPLSRAIWEAKLSSVHGSLGIDKPLPGYVHEVFLDVGASRLTRA